MKEQDIIRIGVLSSKALRGEPFTEQEKKELIHFYINESGLSPKEIYGWLVMIDDDAAQSYFDDHFYMSDGEMCDIPDGSDID